MVSMDTLFTPWRYSYIIATGQDEDCFFCAATIDLDDPERLVVHVADHHIVMLNRHPYSNGHLMVAPRRHVPQPHDCDVAAQAEFWPLVLRTQQVIEQVCHPHGMNLGLNLGRAAGAGVPGHFHFHLVPRWTADTNFMSVLGDVRLVPEDLMAQWRKFRSAFAAEDE